MHIRSKTQVHIQCMALQTSRIKIYAIIRERRKRQKRGIVPCRAGCAASRGATGGSCGRALERAFASCQGAPGRQEWQSAVCGRIGAFRVEGAGEVQWAARAVQMGSADACWRARVARAALDGCGCETARSCASGMGWGVNVNRVSKCIETASNGPGTPILRSVRLRKRMGSTFVQAEAPN